VAARIAHIAEASLCTSIVVVAELRLGIAKRGSTGLGRKLDQMPEVIDVVPFEVPADARYAELRMDLERRGLPIGANDLLIAAHALALGCTVVTANEREFSRVLGLTVENWLR
jgi:tRNA(fMet)-specific endonuclease VapC